MIDKEKEIKIANKVKLEYPKWDKTREFWECTCGKRMVPRPFKVWSENIVNRMYRLRKRELKDQENKIYEDWSLLCKCIHCKRLRKQLGIKNE